METLRYKGFVGSIEAELKDNTLYGKVLGLDAKTMITYEGSTLSELKKDFQNGVDDYIAHCKEHNIPLHKSYSGNFNIRIPSDLHAKIAATAQSAGLSVNAFIKDTLSKAVM